MDPMQLSKFDEFNRSSLDIDETLNETLKYINHPYCLGEEKMDV